MTPSSSCSNYNIFPLFWRVVLGIACCFLLEMCTQYQHSGLHPRQLGWEPDRDLTPYLDTDSMMQSLETVQNPRQKLDSLLEWTDMLKNYQENTALLYAEEAYRIAIEKGYRFSQALAMYYRAWLKGGGQILGEGIEDALADAKISQQLIKSSDDALWINRIYSLLGILYFQNWALDTTYFDTAEYFSLSALQYLEQSSLPEQELNYRKGQNYLELANIFSWDSLRATEYFQKSIQSLESTKNQVLLGSVWTDYGIFYFGKGDLNNAKKAFLKSEALLTSLDYTKKTGGLKNLIYTYQRMADLLNTQYSRSREEHYFLESMQYLEKCRRFKRDLYYTYTIIGYNYHSKSNKEDQYTPEADSAIIYYKKAIEKAGEEGVYYIMNSLVRNISSLCTKRDKELHESCSVLFDDSGYYLEFINDYYANLVDTVRTELQLSNQRLRTFESERQSAVNKRRVRRNWLISGLGLLFAGMLFLLSLQQQQKKRLQARMEALRAQINPHFMSNSLNAIEHLVNMNKREEASKYLIHFSRLSRKLLNSSRSSTSTLSEELETLKHFLVLEKLRFREKLNYQIEVAKDLSPDQIVIPSLLLQPFIENAILHGIKPKTGPGNLWIKVEKRDKLLTCSIEDDGIGREKAGALKAASALKSKHQSQGMKITEERLKALGKVKGSKIEIIDLYNDQGDASGTRVVVQIPYKLKKD